MAQSQAVPSEAAEIIDQIEPNTDCDTVTFKTEKHNRYVFNYEGCVYGHKLPEGYEIRGLGTGWFSVNKP